MPHSVVLYNIYYPPNDVTVSSCYVLYVSLSHIMLLKYRAMCYCLLDEGIECNFHGCVVCNFNF